MIQPLRNGNVAVKCNHCDTLGPEHRDVWEAEALAIAEGFRVTRGRGRTVEDDACRTCATVSPLVEAVP